MIPDFWLLAVLVLLLVIAMIMVAILASALQERYFPAPPPVEPSCATCYFCQESRMCVFTVLAFVAGAGSGQVDRLDLGGDRLPSLEAAMNPILVISLVAIGVGVVFLLITVCLDRLFEIKKTLRRYEKGGQNNGR